MIAFHTTCGIVALLAGGAVTLMEKGTRRHRQAGWVYVASMGLLCATSFLIYELFAGFGVFHVMALVSTASIAGGMVAPLLLRGRLDGHWLEMHYKFMAWSYVGLVMATGSHFFEVLVPFFGQRTPLGQGGSFAATAALCWGLPMAVGAWLIYTRGAAAARRLAK